MLENTTFSAFLFLFCRRKYRFRPFETGATIKGWAVNEDVLSISKQLMEQNKEAYGILAK